MTATLGDLCTAIGQGQAVDEGEGSAAKPGYAVDADAQNAPASVKIDLLDI